MLVNTRTETFVQVEMTKDQAVHINKFLHTIQTRHIEEINKMAFTCPTDGELAVEALTALRDALANPNV